MAVQWPGSLARSHEPILASLMCHHPAVPRLLIALLFALSVPGAGSAQEAGTEGVASADGVSERKR